VSCTLRFPRRNALFAVRLAIAALLIFFSCVRFTPAVSSQTARAPKIVSYLSLTRTAAVEASARGAKVVQPSLLRFVQALVSVVPRRVSLLTSRQNPLVQIWPEHLGALFRRVLPSTFDSAH
jgi:hypothetical protein